MSEQIHWYAAKTRHQCERIIKEKLDSLNVQNYVPFREEIHQWSDRKKKVVVPLIPCMVFIRATEKECRQLLTDYGMELTFVYDRENRRYLIIPDKQMDDFIFVNDFSDEGIRVYNDNLKPGDRVRVIKGQFQGIEGELIRIQGHKRVVIRLAGLFSVATTYIPQAFLERVE